MEKQFVPYELAVKLKELGFDEPCLGVWNMPNGKYEVTLVYGGKLHEGYINDIQSFKVCAPLWQQAFDWFKRGHNLFVTIHIHEKGYSYNIQNIKGSHGMIEMLVSTILPSMTSGKYLETQEIAREEALKDLIKLKSK